jgi:hypothetical protein
MGKPLPVPRTISRDYLVRNGAEILSHVLRLVPRTAAGRPHEPGRAEG